MIDFERILHPTDFSDYSDEALEYACGLAEQFGAELHLMHVIPAAADVIPLGAIGGYLPQGWPEELRTDSDEKLRNMLKDWSSGHKVIKVTEQGSTFVQIVRYANDNAVDLIVMGTHGRTGLSHMLIGSVAEKVVLKASCPVLTIHPGGHTFEMP